MAKDFFRNKIEYFSSVDFFHQFLISSKLILICRIISSERVKKCPGETGHFPYSHKAFRCFLCFCCFLSKRRHLGRVYQMQDDRVFDHSHLDLRFNADGFARFDRYRNIQTVPQC